MARIKAGGRTKGTPNKPTLKLIDRAEKLKVDPFEILLLFAKGDWAALGYDTGVIIKESANGESTFMEYTISPELRAQCAEKACQYIHPKRKAIEHENSTVVVNNNNLSVTSEQLDELVATARGT